MSIEQPASSYSPERRYPRYTVDQTEGEVDARFDAALFNVSLSGMALRTPVSLDVGTEVAVILNSGADHIHRCGEVRWCSRSSKPSDSLSGERRYDMGVTLSGNDADTFRSMLSLIDCTPVLNLSRQLFGRFELDYRKPIEVQSRTSVRVRQLSLGGALLESGSDFHPDTEIDLSIHLDGRRFNTRSRVVNRRDAKDTTEDRVLIGTEFLAPTDDQLDLLQQFITTEAERPAAASS